MENRALGLIEVRGYLGAVAAADATVKAAEVELIQAEVISGGLTTIQVMGDVGAVTAGIESGRMAAEALGCLVASHVIARLDAETQQLIVKKQPDVAKKQPDVVATTPKRVFAYDQLKQLKVEQLRKMALKNQVKRIKKGDIKFANKQTLIDALLAHNESGEDK
ncbi:BMC domain-containing protein [Brochothrix campestris]|uniref:Ethanolamine utilization protein n=1 Tax=Brochothrix campestris FSL F6-1037 TaxID=1265861 RepID=W7CJ39_9LIST|nr:ethanolamine utilization protein [Brochothrix campestris FSL F6-1037]